MRLSFEVEGIPIFTVLLVDDEPLVLEGLTFMIEWERYGFSVCGEAYDGEEALDRIRELDPDLVVTDIRMPAMDGLQLIEHCSNELKARCQFVILSGHDDFESAQKALSNGALDYWLKPIDTEEIHAALRRIHGQWTDPGHAERPDPPTAQLPLDAAWTIPDDPLFEEEDRLLQAVEAGDEAAIGESARRLCRRLESAFGGRAEPGKAFLSHVLMELVWKMTEGDVSSPSREGKSDLALPSLPNQATQWPGVLEEFALQAAKRLAVLRAGIGPAGEAALFVREHYREPLQLQTVARELHFQPAYFGQLFKKEIGMSFIDYVHRTRVEAGRKLLLRTDLKVADVARSVGYADPEQFAAKFKQWMNMSPSQYKNG